MERGKKSTGLSCHPLRPGAWIICLGASAIANLTAVSQSVSTVREAEFRSRWTDYQVDNAKTKKTRAPAPPQEEAVAPDYLARFTQFGPLEFHGGLTTGFEYSDEQYLSEERDNTSNASLFIAPSLAAIYEKAAGSWDLAARYSVGWLYYLDPDYIGSNGDVTTSQTANLSLLRDNERLNIRSLTNASAGTGFDIERGQATDRVAVGETFSVEYQLTEYLRTGASATLSYTNYSTVDGGENGGDSTDYSYAGAVFVDNFLTDKTAYRLEASAGATSQENGGSSNDRTYAQGVVRVNYGPTSKLAFTGSVGLGVRDESQPDNQSREGLRSVYSLTTVYTPSEKTSARLYAGVEGATSEPEFTLTIDWHPREFTFFELSVYQQTGLSNFTTTDERLSKGFLASFRQRLFGRIDTSLSGGYEKIETLDEDSPVNQEDPYYFIALALGWQLNQHLTLQTLYRTSTRRNTFNASESGDGLQNRATLSLSLTF